MHAPIYILFKGWMKNTVFTNFFLVSRYFTPPAVQKIFMEKSAANFVHQINQKDNTNARMKEQLFAFQVSLL